MINLFYKPLKNLKKIFILILLLITNKLLLFSQQLFFTSYDIQHGLSQSVVNCVFHDSQGYMWFGTQNGLNKFDGQVFTKYRYSHIDTNSISDNWIFDITESKDGKIWIATKKGVNCFDKKSGVFKKLKYSLISFDNIVKCVYGIYVDNYQLYINTPPVLTIYNLRDSTYKHYVNSQEIDNTDKNEKIPIFKDSEGLIWIASTKGLAYFDISKQIFNNITAENTLNLPDDFAISNQIVKSICEDNNKNLWFGTANGLNFYNKKTKKIIKYYNNPDDNFSLPSNSINSILCDRNNRLWIGTDKGIASCYLLDNENINIRFQLYNQQKSALINDNIFDITIDNSNNLWVATLKGISKTDLKPQKFRLYRQSQEANSVNLLDNIIASLYKDKENNIWVGNWGKGLNIYNRSANYVKHFSADSLNNYICDNYIHAIKEDSYGHVWIGTRNGVMIYDTDKQKFQYAHLFFNSKNIPNFENNRVNSIIEDKNKNLWFGTQNGLIKINLIDYKTEIYKESFICWNYIYEIMIDSQGFLWIATANGLDMFDLQKNKITHFLKDQENTNSLCDNFVISLCEDFEGNIWIGTNSGLNKYNKKDNSFTFFSVESGLAGNVVYEILEDKNKSLWLATGSGLSKFNHDNNSFTNYSIEEGLQSVEFNLGAKYISPDGEIFFGGMNGFNSFYPDSLSNNLFVPNIVFTKFEVVTKANLFYINVDSVQDIVLDDDISAFTIQFSALEYTNYNKNQYAYKMSKNGKDEEWIHIGTRNFVPFSNLAAGEYVFSVIAANNDGTWNNIGIEINIKILPPWWMSRIAIISYIFIVVFLIYFFIKLRERKLINQRNILEQKVTERTYEINKQKEKIEKAHQEIKDSINYASRIQNAVLPINQLFEQNFSDYFVLFKPKDIVSGDFYWMKKIKHYLVFAVADCTGHGVPGAFVSMLGIALLNEIIRQESVKKSCQVLNELRNQIKISLQQTDYDVDTKDGMDIALCIYDQNNKILDFAGANNSAYIFKNENYNDLIELKATKNPIGIYYKEKDFESSFIEMDKNDRIYLFSDGYVDQFNESYKEKYKTKRFKELLIKINNLPFSQQKDILDAENISWKGTMFQIDDILVMGIKI